MKCLECGSENISYDVGNKKYFCNECEKYFYTESKEKTFTEHPQKVSLTSVKTELLITKGGKNVKLRKNIEKSVKNTQKTREYSDLSLGELYNRLTTNEKLNLYELHNGVYTGSCADDDIDNTCATWLDSLDYVEERQIVLEALYNHNEN